MERCSLLLESDNDMRVRLLLLEEQLLGLLFSAAIGLSFEVVEVDDAPELEQLQLFALVELLLDGHLALVALLGQSHALFAKFAKGDARLFGLGLERADALS